jgi:Putative bacterial sensory transduction regulator
MNARMQGLVALRWSVSLLFVVAASRAGAQPKVASEPPRYAQAMEQELAALGTNAHCERDASGRHHCSWAGRSGKAGNDVAVHAVYSEPSATIYFYVERFLSLPPEAPATNATLRRLMELNWELLVGKFEWNPRTGEVRLSAVLDTDSNFDRRAFRSIVRALDTVTTRYYRELHE